MISKFSIVKKTNLDYENKRLLAHKHPSQKAKNYLLKEYTKSRKQIKIQSNSVKTSSTGPLIFDHFNCDIVKTSRFYVVI